MDIIDNMDQYQKRVLGDDCNDRSNHHVKDIWDDIMEIANMVQNTDMKDIIGATILNVVKDDEGINICLINGRTVQLRAIDSAQLFIDD